MLSWFAFPETGCSEAQEKLSAGQGTRLTAEFNFILDRLREQGRAQRLEGYEAIVVDRRVINAWVRPSGGSKQIYFTRGLLEAFTERELRCVIGHEIAHVELGHWDKRLRVARGAAGAMSTAEMLTPGAGVASVVVNRYLTSTFSRSQEVKADFFALRLINELYGYGADVYVGNLEKIRALTDGTDSETIRKNTWFDSHPSLLYRIERVKEYGQLNGIEKSVREEGQEVTTSAIWREYARTQEGSFSYDANSVVRHGGRLLTVQDKYTLHKGRSGLVERLTTIDCESNTYRRERAWEIRGDNRRAIPAGGRSLRPIPNGTEVDVLSKLMCR